MLFKPSNSHNSLQAKPRPRWHHLILVVLYFLAALFIGQFVGLVLSSGIYSVPMLEVPQVISNFKHPNSRGIIYLLQGCSSFFGFVLGPVLYLYHWGGPTTLGSLLNRRNVFLIPVLLSILITICFMVANSPLIDWNANLTLPKSLSGLEAWARNMEDQAARITSFLIDFTSFGDFMLGLLVVGCLAAFGEELLFRGLLQPIIAKLAKSAHAGIWLAALFFSLFHFQFFGFLPRMALGVLFGYLYYWSGSLVMPMLGHFINNGLTLFLAYLAKTGHLDYNVESTEALPTTAILVCLVVGVITTWSYRQFYIKQAQHGYVEQGV